MFLIFCLLHNLLLNHNFDYIIKEFKKKFSNTTPNVKKPEITNGLDPILIHPPDVESPVFRFKTSIFDHTPNNLQRSSSVHPLNESASDNNHT